MTTKRQMAGILRRGLEVENHTLRGQNKALEGQLTTARHYQERAEKAEAGLAEVTRQRDALLSKTSTRFRDYVQNLEAETGELQERARIAEGRVGVLEAEVLDIRTKSTALFKVMDRQIDEADEVAKRAEERVVVLENTAKALRRALINYGQHDASCKTLDNFAGCECGLHQALRMFNPALSPPAALNEHEHAAQATPDTKEGVQE